MCSASTTPNSTPARRVQPTTTSARDKSSPLGLLDSSLPYMLSAYAALHIPSGTISVINAVTPLWGALVAWLWLGIRLTISGAIGLLIGLVGIIFLVWHRFELALSDSTLALAAAILGPVCYALSA